MKARENGLMSLFRVSLEQICDKNHSLVILADKIRWADFDEQFGSLYHPTMGRPAVSTRMMVGLHYLKYTFDLGDEEVVARFVENPYWQYFCGNKQFVHTPPIDPTSMTNWRKRISGNGMEKLLEATIQAGLDTGVLKKSSLEKLNADTTVQEKAVTFPTDSRLYHRMREKLVELAGKFEISLRQTYSRLSKKAYSQQSRYAFARQMKRAARERKKLKTYLGRVIRDIERKIKNSGSEIKESFSGLLEMAHRIFAQQKTDKNKLYSIHAPEVECISKGKAHKKYEFGCKVGVVTTSKDNFVVGVQAFHDNPYDGHVLGAQLEQVSRLCKTVAKDVFVDRGYKGHGYEGDVRVHIVGGSMRKVTKSLRKWFKRRSAVEPVIGHMKSDSRLNRNYLLGKEGDRINAILSGCGYNLRKLLAAFLFVLFGWMFRVSFKPERSLTIFV